LQGVSGMVSSEVLSEKERTIGDLKETNEVRVAWRVCSCGVGTLRQQQRQHQAASCVR
jgi:hypothetical protein